MQLQLNSPAFNNNEDMPTRCTCEGANHSPPLRWTGAPQATKSFVLIVDDPDAPDPAAPKRTWVHWLLYNLPSHCHELPEHQSAHSLPAPTQQGINDSHITDYDGPCPPIGRHRYFHKLYALDTELPDLHQPHKAQLLAAMKGHVLAEAVLVGTYQKKA
jgi:Raf kinase inhibitor-like YbhB/YbcL family protein